MTLELTMSRRWQGQSQDGGVQVSQQLEKPRIKERAWCWTNKNVERGGRCERQVVFLARVSFNFILSATGNI